MHRVAFRIYIILTHQKKKKTATFMSAIVLFFSPTSRFSEPGRDDGEHNMQPGLKPYKRQGKAGSSAQELICDVFRWRALLGPCLVSLS